MRKDRARIQIGEISNFGLLELSRQRLRPSVIENSSELCPQCGGSGRIQSIEVSAIQILRSIEEEGSSNDHIGIKISAHSDIILHILNKKRTELNEIETRYNISIDFMNDNSIIPPQKKLEIIKNNSIANQELKEIKTNSTSDNEDENENKNIKGKRLNKRKKRAPKQDRKDVKTAIEEKDTFEEKNKIQDIPKELKKKKPRTKTKKSIIKKPKIKSNNKLKDTETQNIKKEKTIETETKEIHTELREIKSSSPIEVTQIDENSSLEKPKKKGWWSQ